MIFLWRVVHQENHHLVFWLWSVMFSNVTPDQTFDLDASISGQGFCLAFDLLCYILLVCCHHTEHWERLSLVSAGWTEVSCMLWSTDLAWIIKNLFRLGCKECKIFRPQQMCVVSVQPSDLLSSSVIYFLIDYYYFFCIIILNPQLHRETWSWLVCSETLPWMKVWCTCGRLQWTQEGGNI